MCNNEVGLAASRDNGDAALPEPSGLDGSEWTRGVNGHAEISVVRRNDVLVGRLKIIGGVAVMAKGTLMMALGIAGAPKLCTEASSPWRQRPHSSQRGLGTFGSGAHDVVGQVTNMHAEYIWNL